MRWPADSVPTPDDAPRSTSKIMAHGGKRQRWRLDWADFLEGPMLVKDKAMLHCLCRHPHSHNISPDCRLSVIHGDGSSSPQAVAAPGDALDDFPVYPVGKLGEGDGLCCHLHTSCKV
ncbi:uncharacterized protein ASPGLDRAFT_47738 [Aspergillus glaucus CBS 516.65]|uniref:Uncharacterized protein n=1 Tax=Aspergillus glaucus CBS 516.65 TaxID=1160497 RepID=A0A1L9VJD9_ASPGL|nr:hypothetical protein ASPGLDRAFT_47738 [Aspergillus glaucus CBS 516.65]OJJ84014.1 hypothetical protein ASPGLDRAFT_47738 [Aspergillus glaucus CBS 516.65]